MEAIQKLTHKKIVSRSEVIITNLGWQAAVNARDALAKHLYAELFNWLVAGANKALRCTENIAHFIGENYYYFKLN